MRPAGTSKAAWSLPCAQQFVVEAGVEDVGDELRHRAAAGAVGEVDAAVAEIELRRSARFDASRRLARARRRIAEAAVGPVRGAGAFGGDHAGAHRRLRRAGRAEQLAVAPASSRRAGWRRIRRPGCRRRPASRRSKRLSASKRGVGRRAASARCRAPSPARATRSCRAARRPRRPRPARCSLPSRGDRADILVLDLGAALVDLAHQHQDRLHHVERLEAGDHHRLAVFVGEDAVGLRCR